MKKDLLFVLLFPLAVFIAVFCFGLHLNYFSFLLLFFGVPSLYLSLKNKQKVKKLAIFTLLMSIPTAIIFELVTFWDQAWTLPESILSYRLFGFSAIENYLWMFLTTYIILIFYEHFCTTSFKPTLAPRVKIMNTILYSATVIIILIYLLNKQLLAIPYAYLWLCIPFFLIPITLFFFKYPSYITPFFKVQMYFFTIHLIFELIGLYLNYWTFDGTHYLGWISFLNLRFPIEEFFFVILWGGFAPLVYYEFFANANTQKRLHNIVTDSNN